MKVDKQKMVLGEQAFVAMIMLVITLLFMSLLVFFVYNFPAISTILLLSIVPLVLFYYFLKVILIPALYYIYFRYFKKVKISAEDRDDSFV